LHLFETLLQTEWLANNLFGNLISSWEVGPSSVFRSVETTQDHWLDSRRPQFRSCMVLCASLTCTHPSFGTLGCVRGGSGPPGPPKRLCRNGVETPRMLDQLTTKMRVGYVSKLDKWERHIQGACPSGFVHGGCSPGHLKWGKLLGWSFLILKPTDESILLAKNHKVCLLDPIRFSLNNILLVNCV
jgi:hypothetical protein